MDNSFYYLVGDKFNALEDAIAVTPTSEDPLFVRGNLFSQDQGEVFRFNSAGVDDNITIDLSENDNGDFEDWTEIDVPDDWTDESTGTGALSEETIIVNTGVSSLKLVGSGASDIAICQQEIKVISGRLYGFSGVTYASSSTVKIQIFCLETGKYLTSANVWQTGVANITNNGAAAWTIAIKLFTIDNIIDTGKHLLTLRISILAEGTGYADDIALYPNWNFASIHGHNLGSMITPEIRKSSDNFVANDVLVSSAIALQWPSFYEILGSTVNARYARLKLVGTNHEPIEISKLVISFITALPQSQQGPYNIDPTISNIIYKSRGGHAYKLALAEYENQSLPLSWILTDAQFITFRNEIEKRTKLGNSRAVIVPDSARDEVYFGSFGSAFPTERTTTMGIFRVSNTFQEDGFVMRVQ